MCGFVGHLESCGDHQPPFACSRFGTPVTFQCPCNISVIPVNFEGTVQSGAALQSGIEQIT